MCDFHGLVLANCQRYGKEHEDLVHTLVELMFPGGVISPGSITHAE